MNDALHRKLQEAPKAPGCYLFKDDMDHIIYVGKAKALYSRVRSYFTAAAEKDERIKGLIRQIADVDFWVAPCETDALLEEYRLIKQHKPWFNSQLKREAPHPFLRVDMDREYPTVTIAQEAADDGAEYFGRFYDVYDAQEAIETLNSVWHTPLCKKTPLPSAACLYHALRQCSGPCIAAIDSGAYRAGMAEAMALLRGHFVPALEEIRQALERHTADWAFEKAAQAQKKLEALERLRKKGHKMLGLREEQDAVVLLRAYHAQECVLFYVVRGQVRNRAYFAASMEVEQRERLLYQALAKCDPKEAEPWLIPCIGEVFADKRFLWIGKEEALREIGEKAAVLMQEFFTEGR